MSCTKIKFITFAPTGDTKNYIYGEKTIDNISLSSAYIANKINEDIHFTEPYLPYIFRFKNGKIERRYKIDFHDNFPPVSVLNKFLKLKHPVSTNDRLFINDFFSKYASFFSGYFENEKWVILHTSFKDRTLIYNKNDKTTYEYSGSLLPSKTKNYSFQLCYLSGDSLYRYTNYSIIKKILDAGDNMSEQRKSMLEDIIKNMKYDDNPIIVKSAITKIQ